MKAAVLGLYLPIVVLGLAAAYLLVTRLIVPGLRAHRDLTPHLIGVAAACSLAAHVMVACFSFAIRSGIAPQVGLNYWLLGAITLMTLAACVAATAGLSHAITGRARFGLIGAAVAVLWGLGIWGSA